MTVTQFLKDHVPFLKGLTEDQAHYLAKSAEQKPFSKGQTVIFQGVTVDGLHVVAQGKVSVWIRPDKRKDAVQVATLGPGDIFGEASIIEFTVAGATIKAVEDDTLVFVVPEEAFRKLLAIDEDLKTRTMALIESRRQERQAQSNPKKEEKKEDKPAA